MDENEPSPIQSMSSAGFEPVHFDLPKPLQQNMPTIRKAMEIWKSYIQIEVLDTDEIGKSLIKAGKFHMANNQSKPICLQIQ